MNTNGNGRIALRNLKMKAYVKCTECNYCSGPYTDPSFIRIARTLHEIAWMDRAAGMEHRTYVEQESYWGDDVPSFNNGGEI